jgi:glycerol-3-phosphate dehydrogenase
VKPVLILGAGINGAAVARDLAINGIPVCIVDTGDVAGGATSRSSRLIHGGLRYLEYRDTALVRESLVERERLLKLAPQFVKPLRLTIPVEHRFGGLWAGFVRFSGLARTSIGKHLLKFGRGPRGLLAIKAGLTMYDRLARSDSLPPHEIHRANNDASPSTPTTIADNKTKPCDRFRWLCSYSDAQIEFPERFVLAMLEDARRAAAASGTMFEVLPYHKTVASESSADISIISTANAQSASNISSARTISPSVIVNATGAWGDRTLESLGLCEKPLFAGTKGSHLFTTHQPLIDALGNDGIYAEADDGRLVFILPCAGGVLIGTTDEPFADDPGNAVTTPDEIQYLVRMVAEVFPNTDLTADHVSMHHAGVRPLPKCDSKSAAAIPRRHSIEQTTLHGIPILTLVGGKLTTCRSLAEEVCHRICSTQHLTRRQQTTDRPLPGSGDTCTHSLSAQDLARLAAQHHLHVDQVATVWPLIGDRLYEPFPHRGTATSTSPDIRVQNDSLCGTHIPKSFAKWSITHEWCTTLEDLVERRLMLIFHPTIQHTTLQELAEELVNAGRLQESQIDSEIDRVSQRLQTFYGKTVIRH